MAVLMAVVTLSSRAQRAWPKRIVSLLGVSVVGSQLHHAAVLLTKTEVLVFDVSV
jgi:hypothetical protein